MYQVLQENRNTDDNTYVADRKQKIIYACNNVRGVYPKYVQKTKALLEWLSYVIEMRDNFKMF